MEQEFQGEPGTQVIDRGAHLLALVLESDAPRGLTDLAADAGLPLAAVQRIVRAGGAERERPIVSLELHG